MRPLVLIRPEPGLTASAERAQAMGLEVIRWPLFRIEPVAWSVPDADDYDAMLLTSANAARQAGSGLSQLSGLPVYAVGNMTAEVARQAGLSVIGVGDAGVDALLQIVPTETRLLHPTGAEQTMRSVARTIRDIIVYRSVTVEGAVPAVLVGSVVAVHSPRAGRELAARIANRASITIAAISEVAAIVCGSGWAQVSVAEKPDDGHLLSLAATLCQTGGQ